MPKKLDPDYEPPTDEQIAEAIASAKKIFADADQRLREKLSQIVPGFDSADNESWIRLACRLTTKWGTNNVEWEDMPLPDLLVYVDEAVRSELATWTRFTSAAAVAKYLRDKKFPAERSTVQSWLNRNKHWIKRYDGSIYVDLRDAFFANLDK